MSFVNENDNDANLKNWVVNKLVIRSSLKILALKFEYFDVSFITELFFIRRLIKSKNDHDLQTFLNIYTSILQQIKQF